MKNENLKGYLLALVTVSIWAGWMIVTRLGMKTDLTAMDVTFLRFTTAGLLLFPLAYKNRKQIFKTPFWILGLMLLGAGAPYVLVSALGFHSSPASHGILIPGTMPLWVALLSSLFFKERFSKARLWGYAFIFVGMIFKLTLSFEQGWTSLLFDGYFIFASILWAIYTLSSRKANMDPFTATAWVTTGSALALVLPYLFYQIQYPHSLNLNKSLVQIFYQGILTSIVSLITFNKAVKLIGASSTSAFAALVPALVTLLAIPFLDETPQFKDFIFIGLMTLGVLLASGLISKKVKT